MHIYLLYFLIGGAVVATAVFIGSRAGGVTAALVAGLPILDTINVTLLYRQAGPDASVAYAKTILCLVPILACLLILAIWLLPQVHGPEVLLPGLSLYAVPLVIRRIVQQRSEKQSIPGTRPKKDQLLDLHLSTRKPRRATSKTRRYDKSPPRRVTAEGPPLIDESQRFPL